MRPIAAGNGWRSLRLAARCEAVGCPLNVSHGYSDSLAERCTQKLRGSAMFASRWVANVNAVGEQDGVLRRRGRTLQMPLFLYYDRKQKHQLLSRKSELTLKLIIFGGCFNFVF